MPILTREDIDNGLKLMKDYNAFEEQVSERIGEILRIICKCYGANSSEMWWDYAGDDRDYGDGGTLSQCWYGNSINVVSYQIGDPTIDITEWPDEMCNIPASWLRTEDSKIETEILKFIQTLRDEKAAEAKTKASAKAKKAELKKQAAAKLTAEERKALGIK